MAPPSEEPRAVTRPPVARSLTLQTKTGRPLRDGPSLHAPITMEGYFFAVFLVLFVTLFVFFAAFLGAFALVALIALATFRS